MVKTGIDAASMQLTAAATKWGAATQINEALREKKVLIKKRCLSFDSDEPGGGSLKKDKGREIW